MPRKFRTMTRWIAFSLAVFVAAIAAGSLVSAAGSGAPHARKRCPPAHATVVASGRLAVAYKRGDAAYACYRRTGRRLSIGSEGPSSSCSEAVSLIRISSRYAAWNVEQFCFAQAQYHIFRANLKKGQLLKGEPTGTPSCPSATPSCGAVGNGPASALVLTKRASVAWIAGSGETVEVWSYDHAGRKLLARGSAIDRAYLRLRHNEISWREAGDLHRATLRP
jgi:hypothetical protein